MAFVEYREICITKNAKVILNMHFAYIKFYDDAQFGMPLGTECRSERGGGDGTTVLAKNYTEAVNVTQFGSNSLFGK